MAYANALRSSVDRYLGESTVIASIKNNPMTVEEVATELKNQGIYEQVEGIQISHNKNMVEIIIPDEEAKTILVTEGLCFQNTFIDFKPDIPITINVSFFNVPLEMPEELFYSHLEKYGTTVSSFKAKKKILGKVIEIGTRDVQFSKLNGPIPKMIHFANRTNGP